MDWTSVLRLTRIHLQHAKQITKKGVQILHKDVLSSPPSSTLPSEPQSTIFINSIKFINSNIFSWSQVFTFLFTQFRFRVSPTLKTSLQTLSLKMFHSQVSSACTQKADHWRRNPSHANSSPFQFVIMYLKPTGDSRVAQTAKNLLAMQGTWVPSLDQENPLEKEMAPHSSILAWRIPRTEQPGGLQSTGLQTVGYNWVTFTHSLISPTTSPRTTVISLAYFLRCYHDFFLVKPPKYLPITWAASIILWFFEKIGTMRWENNFLLPLSNPAIYLAFVSKYSASHPVTGDESSLILSKATWAVHPLPFITPGLYYYSDPLSFYKVFYYLPL